MAELGDSLERMSFVQLLLLFGFVTSYVLALGGMLGVRSRQRAALLALALALAFSALTDPWVHGALLMVFVIAGLGLFVMLSWVLARWLGPSALPTAGASAEAAEAVLSASLPSDSQPAPLRQGDAAHPVSKLARGAPSTRVAR
ncbi:MAG: hypothetical protein ACRC2B_12155 [Rubrivivax sp.]